PPTTLHYQLSVTETGLPTSASWNATVGVTGASGTVGTLTLSGLSNGTYTLSVPTVYGSTGTRYVPNQQTVAYTSTQTVDGSNLTATVTFTTQYLLTVEVSGNGTVSPGTGWINSGTAVTLTATPNGTLPGQTPWKFANWTTTTPGVANETTASYSGLTMSGAVTLTASFVPAYVKKTTSNAFTGAPVAFGLLALLLVVGLVIAYVATRRRASTSGAPAEPEAAATPEEGPPPPPQNGEEPAALGEDQAEWAEPELPPAVDMNQDGRSD
ncbi:MAG: hypothetical protein L3J99_02440, partial [Thermoplasmata archaeon]|nr:hypothetical protein [Thermoplasmata archaeon]